MYCITYYNIVFKLNRGQTLLTLPLISHMNGQMMDDQTCKQSPAVGT